MTSKGISRVIEHECCSHAQRHGLDEEDVRDLMIEAMALVTQSCAVGAVETSASTAEAAVAMAALKGLASQRVA